MLGHLLAISAFAVCVLLGWWQLARFESPTGGVQNAAYALQWPLFGVFALFFWIRAMRDSVERRVPVRFTGQGRATTEASAQIRRDEQDDPELAAYNRYLAELSALDRKSG